MISTEPVLFSLLFMSDLQVWDHTDTGWDALSQA